MWSPTQRALSRSPLASDKITFELLVCIFISSVNLKTTVQHRLRDPLALGHSHFSPGKMQQPLRHAPLLPLLPSPQDWPPLSSQVLLSVSQIKSHPSRNRSVNSRFAGLKPKSVGSCAIRLELPLRFSAPPTSRSLSVAVSTEVLCSALRQDLPQGLGTGCSLGPGHLKPRHQPTRSLTCSKSCLNIILSICPLVLIKG